MAEPISSGTLELDEAEDEPDRGQTPVLEVQFKNLNLSGSKSDCEEKVETSRAGGLPRETEMEGESGKQQHSEVEMDDIHVDKSAQELDLEEEETATEEEYFSRHISDWEYTWGSMGCGRFEDTTLLSSMHLTPIPSTDDGVAADTLQIFSIKLAEIKGGFEWPLFVYGVVAARDPVDHNRNLLFWRTSRNGQIVQQNDPFLRLTGPSRGIVFNHPVQFEIQLRAKHAAMPRDRALISATYNFCVGYCGVQNICFENTFCKIELCMELVCESVQATICSIRVVKQGRRQRVGRRCRVACSTTPSSGEVVLLNPGTRAMPEYSDGYLDLSRRVVSVQYDGCLKVVVEAYSASYVMTAQGHISLAPKSSGFSQKKFNVDDAELEITVALVPHGLRQVLPPFHNR